LRYQPPYQLEREAGVEPSEPGDGVPVVDEPLHGFILKLNRAEEHFRAVRSSIHAFVESDFYDIASDLDHKGRLVGRVSRLERPEPNLSVLIGDCIHNFRSALDQLAYELATRHTNPLPPQYAKTSAFPIYNSGPAFRGKKGVPRAARKMRGMSRYARGAIERLQPYHRRKAPALQALWWLEELSNIDKHRQIHLTGAVPVSASFSIQGTGRFHLRTIEAFPGPMKLGAKVARLHGEFSPPPQVTVDAYIKPDVVFDKNTQAQSVRGYSVLNVLAAIREAAGYHVLHQLGPEISRLYPGIRFHVTFEEEQINEREEASVLH
jgi:hypothetical protein